MTTIEEDIVLILNKAKEEIGKVCSDNEVHVDYDFVFTVEGGTPLKDDGCFPPF